MINFNFTLDELDAQNFCSIIHNNITNHMANLIGNEYNEAEKKWIEGHIKYLKGMQQTIESSIVKVP